MSVLLEACKILGTAEGGLVYYLVVLWVVLASLTMAWGEWRRSRREQARRLLLAMAGLLLARVAYAVATLLEQEAARPPLERFADLVSVGLLAWAFMPPPKRSVRLWDLVFGANLVLAVGVCVGFIVSWNRVLASVGISNYGLSWQTTVWTVWQAGLILLVGVAAVRSRGEGWEILTAAMAIMLLGTLLQWYYPLVMPSVPVLLRMANLVAYPLVAVAVYRHIAAILRVQSRQLEDISQASLDQIKSLLFLFEASQRISSSLDLATILENAVSGIARALDADQCAIAFPEESDSGQMRLAAIHNPARQGRGEAVAFPLDYQLAVQQAMRRKKYVIVEESDNVQVKVLFALLGSGETGPLLVQPLVSAGEAIGAIIVGNSRSRRPFAPNEAKLCQSMAEQVVGAIQNARRHQAAQRQIEELAKAAAEDRRALQQAQARMEDLADELATAQSGAAEIRRREELAREERNALEIKFVSSRAESEALSRRVAVLESDLAQAHASAEAQSRWQEQERGRQEADWGEVIETAERVLSVMHGMTAGVLVTDAQGVIREGNVAAEILLERGKEELHALELEKISDNEQWHQAVATASGGEAVRLTIKVGANTLLCDVAPLPDPESPQGEIKGLVAVMQDVSAEIEEQRVRLEAIATLSEELRSPLTTVVSYADLLLTEAVGIVGSAQRKFLLRIKAGAERMAQMANELIREAGGEERWSSPLRQTVDVNKLIEATLASSQLQLEDRSLSLDLDLPEDIPPIRADPDYLRRVVSKLFSNACLASSAGGRILIRTAKSHGLALEPESMDLNGDGYVIVMVQDSGGGLSDEALNQVFDPARPSRTPPGLGESGASMALVKTLVEAHGGRLWVESQSGVGTTISCVLPVADQSGRLASWAKASTST